MKKERIIKFLNEYIKYNKKVYYPIGIQLDSSAINEHVKDNNNSVTLHKAFPYIENVIKNNSNRRYNHKDEWWIFNTTSRKIDDINFSFYSTNTFEIDITKKKITHNKKEEYLGKSMADMLKQQNWILVKISTFFLIRNALKVLSKMVAKSFSIIDKKILQYESYVTPCVAKQLSLNLNGYQHKLDEYQFQIFKNAIESNDLFMFKGPPGTGKTQLISYLAEYYVKKGKKVFFSSALHSALDSLVDRLNKMPEMKNVYVKRATYKAGSKHFQNKDDNFANEHKKYGKLFITTFASYKFNDQAVDDIGDRNNVLIVDEASAVNVMSILSKTSLANKIIVAGDNAQFYPIFNNNDRQEFKKRELIEEFDFMIKQSLFDLLFKVNKKEIPILKNNYRSSLQLTKKINFFYDDQLISKSPLAPIADPVQIIKVKSYQNMMLSMRDIVSRHDDLLSVTYYKDDVNHFNEQIKKARFSTLSSVQGLEKEYVLWVLTNTRTSSKMPEIDYRHVNMAISRAKKKVFIIDYSSNNDFLTDLPMIKSLENSATFKRKGVSFSIKDVVTSK